MENNIIEQNNNLQNIVDSETDNIILLQKKVKVFEKDIYILREDILNIPDINGTFSFLNPIFNNFIAIIRKYLIQFKDLILNPLDNLIDSFLFAKEKKLNSYKDIENDISKAKKDLQNKKNTYSNYNKESENEEKHSKNIFNIKRFSKKDDNIFNEAIKENYNQLYQYELNKMDEIIEENKIKYNNIYNEINAINLSLRLSIKDCIINFAKSISNISDAFSILSKEITEKIDLIKIDAIEKSSNPIQKYSLSDKDMIKIDEENKKEGKNKRNSIKEKRKIFNFSFFKRKTISNLSNTMNIKDDNDLKINNEENDKEKEKINIEFFNKVIKNIAGENELKSKEIIDLFNILQLNELESHIENKYAKIFFNTIKKSNNNRIIFFRNKNNFNHLSHIMNGLCLKYKNNNNILFLIIKISLMVKYKNEFLYKIIQRRNEIFNNKKLWLQYIDNDLMAELNNFVEKLLSKEIQKDFNIKDNGKIKNNFVETSGLSKKIKDYKKLNNYQKKELIKFSKENICLILSKAIYGMYCFIVPEEIINDILNHYEKQFKLEIELKNYLNNKMSLYDRRINNQIKYDSEKDENQNNKIIIISSLSKFYQIKDYPLLFKLNKELYPYLRKNIFLNLLSDKNLSIESHLLLWKVNLEIDKLKKKYIYQDIKKEIYISPDKDEINEKLKDEKYILVISKDLLRTKFVIKNNEHFNKLKSILVCLAYIFPKIEYCQGMHYIASFLYQILGYNEEETFYFMCGIELNTKYHEIFEDNFETLKILLQVFEKILIINRPQIYFKFLDSHLITNMYFSTWLITLFTDCVYIFDKDNIPKIIFFIIEKFIIEGWPTLFNLGFTILEYGYDKIMALEKDKLNSFVINILDNEEILKNENYEKIKNLYLKNSKIINKFFIEKLIDITKFEENNKFTNEIMNIIGIINV